MRVQDMLGAPRAVKHWDSFYNELTTKYGFGPKAALVGLSRGGLYCYNWAAANLTKFRVFMRMHLFAILKAGQAAKAKARAARAIGNLFLMSMALKTKWKHSITNSTPSIISNP